MTRDEAFEFLDRTARGIAEMFGSSCETLVHDMGVPTHPILSIYNGHVSGREVGSTMDIMGIGLELDEQAATTDQVNLAAATPDGRQTKSSTFHMIGEDYNLALGINFDYTSLVFANRILVDLMSAQSDLRTALWQPGNSRQLADLFDQCVDALGKPLDALTKADRLKVIALLRQRSAFSYRKSVPYVAGRLGVSRYTVYKYLDELSGEDGLTTPVFWQTERKGRDRADKPEYKVKLSVSFCFSNKVQLVEHYHNSSWLEHGGSPEKAVRSAFVSAIDSWLKQQNKYTKGESKITFPDIQDALVLVSNNFSTQTSYENQTKKAINNKGVQEVMTEFLRAQMEVYFIENPQDAQKIAEQVLINKRARENAEKTRLNIKKKLTGSMDISNRVQKFVPCRTRDVNRSELYIVEGDSALGSVKQARDGEFQAIMPIRGKILNCLKADYGKIFKSEIITDLLKVLGCGVEVHDKRAKDMAAFDLSALRWNKIVICTDADVDGFQIRTLVLTMLYRLTPTLIQKGYVYIAESPLFEITCKEKTWFAYSNKEKDDIVATLQGKKYDVQRSKGLGENEPEMMWLTTMSPDTRRLIKVVPEDIEQTARMFDLLLGDDLTGRKTHIADHGHEFLELADIS